MNSAAIGEFYGKFHQRMSDINRDIAPAAARLSRLAVSMDVEAPLPEMIQSEKKPVLPEKMITSESPRSIEIGHCSTESDRFEKVRQLFKEYEARFLTPLQLVMAATPTIATSLSQPSSFISCTSGPTKLEALMERKKKTRKNVRTTVLQISTMAGAVRAQCWHSKLRDEPDSASLGTEGIGGSEACEINQRTKKKGRGGCLTEEERRCGRRAASREKRKMARTMIIAVGMSSGDDEQIWFRRMTPEPRGWHDRANLVVRSKQASTIIGRGRPPPWPPPITTTDNK